MEKKSIILDETFDPAIIKSLNQLELIDLSKQIREEIIKACSKNGGHLSSNLGVVELTMELFRVFSFPKDKLIFDVGHQCYTEKILTGRKLDNLRKENGVNGFQKKSESIYDCYEAGHSSTSISAAMGMAISRDLAKDDYEIVVVIGDSSIANGMALEAINNLVSFNHKVIIILNDNNMSIGQVDGALHNFLQNIRVSNQYLKAKDRYRKTMVKHKFTKAIYSITSRMKNSIKNFFMNTNILDSLGIHYLSKVDGHDFKSLHKAFEKAKSLNKSVLIHVSTIKGKGYKYSENDLEGTWHGVSSFDVESGKMLTTRPDNHISWSQIYSSLLDQVMENDKQAIVINPATTVGSCLTTIMKKYPERAIDVGISEEHAVTLASGIANNGYKPYVSIYSTFMQRSYDQILHDVARMNLPVTFLIDRAGLVGADGETHQGIFDTSFLINMPNMTVCMASNDVEAAKLMKLSLTFPTPLAIRYPRSYLEIKDPINLSNVESLIVRQWDKLRKDESDSIALITYGPYINTLVKELVNVNGVTIINAIFQTPINQNIINELLEYDEVVIYDPYGIKEGFSFHVQNALLEIGYRSKITIIAIPNTFIKCGTITQQEKRYGIDTDTVVNLIKDKCHYGSNSK